MHSQGGGVTLGDADRRATVAHNNLARCCLERREVLAEVVRRTHPATAILVVVCLQQGANVDRRLPLLLNFVPQQRLIHKRHHVEILQLILLGRLVIKCVAILKQWQPFRYLLDRFNFWIIFAFEFRALLLVDLVQAEAGLRRVETAISIGELSFEFFLLLRYFRLLEQLR